MQLAFVLSNLRIKKGFHSGESCCCVSIMLLSRAVICSLDARLAFVSPSPPPLFPSFWKGCLHSSPLQRHHSFFTLFCAAGFFFFFFFLPRDCQSRAHTLFSSAYSDPFRLNGDLNQTAKRQSALAEKIHCFE